MFKLFKSYFRATPKTETGSFVISDPRPSALTNPYTFHLPTPAELDALRPGHVIKLIFQRVPASEELVAERMWVTITSRSGHVFSGRLENDPVDIPALAQGDKITFEAFQIVAIYWEDEEDRARFDEGQDVWFSRARVDPRITAEGLPVRYMYRERPQKLKDSAYPDSGWRLCADESTNLDEIDAPYLAIGVVLNRDDSFVELLGAEPGQAFQRPPDATQFKPIQLNG